MKNKTVLNISVAYFLMLSVILLVQISEKEIQAIEPLPSELTMQDKLKSSVVLGLNSPVTIIDEKQFIIDENDATATPIISNGKIYIPVVLLETAFNANVNYSVDTQEATVRLDNKALIFSNDKNIITVIDNISSEEVDIEAEPKIINDRFYIPLRSFADIFNKEIFYADELIIITNIQDIFDPIEEFDTIEKLSMQVQKLPIVGNTDNLKNLINNSNSKNNIILSKSNIINKNEYYSIDGFNDIIENMDIIGDIEEIIEEEVIDSIEEIIEEEVIDDVEEIIEEEIIDDVEEIIEEVIDSVEEIIEEESQEIRVLINQTDTHNFYITENYIKIYERLHNIDLDDEVISEEQEDIKEIIEDSKGIESNIENIDAEEVIESDIDEEVIESSADSIDAQEVINAIETEKFLFKLDMPNYYISNIEHILLSDNNLIISYQVAIIDSDDNSKQNFTVTYIYDITDINNIKQVKMLENNGVFYDNILDDDNFYSISKIDLSQDLSAVPMSNEFIYQNNINVSVNSNEFELDEIYYFPDKNDLSYTIVTYVDLLNPEKLYTNVYFGMGDKIEVYKNNFYVATTNPSTSKSNIYLFEMYFNEVLSTSKISIFDAINSINFDDEKKMLEVISERSTRYVDENLTSNVK